MSEEFIYRQGSARAKKVKEVEQKTNWKKLTQKRLFNLKRKVRNKNFNNNSTSGGEYFFRFDVFLKYLNQWNLTKSQEKEFTEHNKKQPKKIQSKSAIMRWLCCFMPSKSRYSRLKCIFSKRFQNKLKAQKRTLNMNKKMLCFWYTLWLVEKKRLGKSWNLLEFFKHEIDKKKQKKSILIWVFTSLLIFVEQSSSLAVVASNKVIYFEKRQCGKRAYKAAGVQKKVESWRFYLED